MLSLISILVRVKNKWINIETDSLISEILKYNRIFITIENMSTTVVHQYDLLGFPSIYTTDPTVTLGNYISAYIQALPQPNIPILDITKPNLLRFYTLWDYGLVANRTNLSNLSLTFNLNDTPDIKITPDKSFTNTIESLQDKVLFVINGVILNESYHGEVITIPFGGLELDVDKDQTVGVIDFSEFGGFTRIPLTIDNVSVFKVTDEYISLHITLDSEIVKNVILVTNGRLHSFNDIYTQVDSKTVAVSLRLSDVIKEAFTSDPSQLNWIDRLGSNSTGFNINSFDPIKYLTRVNSFLLFINEGILSVDELPICSSGFPNTQLTFGDPTDLLFLSDGTIGYYVVNEIISEFNTVLSVSNPRVYDSVMDTTNFLLDTVVGDGALSPTFESDKVRLRRIYTL